MVIKKIFACYSYSQRELLENFHLELKRFLKEKYGIDFYAFVFEFTKKVDDKTLMRESLSKIDNADMMLVDLSKNSVGVGIEAGYGKAKGKPIIYLLKKGIQIKQTMNGIADEIIEYESAKDVIEKLMSSKYFQS
jgi:nucleoside 2-deoxyribosyltransferase